MDLAITGLGMVSPLGGAVQSCAAIRCGMSRPAPLDPPFLAMDLDADEPFPVTGHPIDRMTSGYQGIGRLKRLARAALEDLRSGYDEAAWRLALQGCQIILCLGDDLPDRMSIDEEDHAGIFDGALMPGVGVRPPVHVVARGPASALMALEVASSAFRVGAAERALILAVDTYADQESVEWLAERHRLKSPESATGLMPGEAAACVLVEPPRTAARRKASALATVAALATGTAPVTDPPHVGIARTVGAAVADALGGQRGNPPPGEMILNLNGETSRAMAWGFAAPLLQRRVGPLDGRKLVPAESLGETGAAFGAVAMCMVARSFSRGYAENGEALAIAIPDRGNVAACRFVATGPYKRSSR